MLKKYWHDPVWSKVIASAILSIAGVVAYYWQENILKALRFLYNWCVSTTLISNWILFILCASFLIVIFIIIIAIWGLLSQKKDTSNFSNYTEDTFFNLKWRWSYYGGKITNLNTFCPNCDYQIYARDEGLMYYPYSDRIAFQCEECHFRSEIFNESRTSLDNRVIRKIQVNIRKKVA